MTAAPAPRPSIVVRPMDRVFEMAYLASTSVDAIVETHGGRFARREVFREIMGDIIERSTVEVAKFDDDPMTIMGFTIWAPDRTLEFLYLRASLSHTKCPPECLGCLQGTRHSHLGRRIHKALAVDFAMALLGPPAGTTRLVRMRRKPPQEWAWNAVKAGGYVPSIVPEGI
jgi:hypothetical protein